MKKFLLPLFTVVCCAGLSAQNRFFSDVGNNKQFQTNGQRVIIPQHYRSASLDVQTMKDFLWSLPDEKNILYNRNSTPILELPMPDGSMAKFHVWESSIQEPALAAKFPEIKTFAGQGIDDPYATIRFDYNPYFGFSAQILSPNGRVYIDPYAKTDIHNYISYYQADNKRDAGFICSFEERNPGAPEPITNAGPCLGTQLRTFRLAITCTGEYAQTVGAGLAGPTHAAIVASANRVTQVYENDLAIRLVLIANNNLVEFLNPATDPYANDGNNDLNIITSVINNAVGSANYDIGHLFCTNEINGVGAGVAFLGVVCTGNKGGGLTGRLNPVGDGYDIDYVAHEMGHQFGASHTFNSNNCASAGGSYEPGSGTTIMAYAGICSPTENIQPHSDAVFHARSFDQIGTFVSTGTGASCASLSATGNTLPLITSVTPNNLSIPIGTPFELTATATDADGDALTYNWEGWDAGAAGSWPSAANSTTRPLFRTRVSKTTGTRTFPDIRVIAANYPGTGAPSAMDGLRGEVLPQIARVMKFRLTVRDNRAGGGGNVSFGEGCQNTSTFQVNAVGTAPFTVTVPNGGESYFGGSSQTITWNVAGTDAAPINVANVKISLSTDGGLTYPTIITASTPNDGTEVLTIPSIVTATARIKVEAIGNIFFDISNTNFTINAPPVGFNFNTPAAAVSACPASTSMSVTLGTISNGGFLTPINLSAIAGVPAGTNITFGTNPVTPGNSTVITLNNTNTLSAGSYVVTISGTAGAITTTRDITFTINTGAGPVIATQPASQTVCAGSDVTFTVVAAGSFQWQVSTAAVPVFTNIGGATSATYSITGATAGLNGNQYRVIVTGQCGSTNSNTVVLTVNTAPVISAHPQNVTLCAGSNNTFNVTATGSGLNYQWQVSTPAVPAFTDIPGASSPTYTVNGITAGMNGNQYRSVVSGLCTPVATSNPATLTVVIPTTVASQPANAVVCNGSNTSFSVAGSGSGVIYQWQVNDGTGFVNISNASPYSGANAATLVITGATTGLNNYQYRAQLSNAICTSPVVSNTVTLTVNTLPVISANPVAATICVGSSNTFSTTATGTGISYQWQISTAAAPTFVDIPGATAATYTASNVTAAMNGNQYRSIVSGTCAPPAISNAALLTVISPVVVTTQPANVELCSGSNTSFTVVGNSSQTISYQWQVSTSAVPAFTNIAGATSATLPLTAVTTNMSGNQYRLQLSNTTCTAPVSSNIAALTVRQLPTVGLAAAPLLSLLPGQTTTLTATPSAQTTGTLTTSWLKNGAAISNGGNSRIINVENTGAYRVNIQEVFASGLTCANQSPTVTIDATVSDRLFIFPSPNDGHFTISYYNSNGAATSRKITVFDSKGSMVSNKSFPVSGPYTLISLDIRPAQKGIYYVVVGDASGKVLIDGKVLIQ